MDQPRPEGCALAHSGRLMWGTSQPLPPARSWGTGASITGTLPPADRPGEAARDGPARGVRHRTAITVRRRYGSGMNMSRFTGFLNRSVTSEEPAIAGRACPHAPEGEAGALPRSSECEECGSRFNLRLCATCGHVGCCESQAGDARAHALREGHPVIYSMPAGRGFIWCYTERRYVG